MTKLNSISWSSGLLSPPDPNRRGLRMPADAAGTVQFSFVGEITPTVLRGGRRQAQLPTMPGSWAGGRVSGVVSLDMARARGIVEPQGYAYADDTAGSDWISVALRHPDGSLFELPAPIDIGPRATDVSRVTLNTGDDGTAAPARPGFFQIERTLSCATTRREQAFVLDLGSALGAPTWSTAGRDPTDVHSTQVDTAYADRTNVGIVRQCLGEDKDCDYAFTFLSVTHMAPVAEPAEWASLACGLGLVGWARRR